MVVFSKVIESEKKRLVVETMSIRYHLQTLRLKKGFGTDMNLEEHDTNNID